MCACRRPDIHHDILSCQYGFAAAPDHRSIAHDGIILRDQDTPLQDAPRDANIPVADVLDCGFLDVELRHADDVGYFQSHRAPQDVYCVEGAFLASLHRYGNLKLSYVSQQFGGLWLSVPVSELSRAHVHDDQRNCAVNLRSFTSSSALPAVADSRPTRQRRRGRPHTHPPVPGLQSRSTSPTSLIPFWLMGQLISLPSARQGRIGS